MEKKTLTVKYHAENKAEKTAYRLMEAHPGEYRVIGQEIRAMDQEFIAALYIRMYDLFFRYAVVKKGSVHMLLRYEHKTVVPFADHAQYFVRKIFRGSFGIVFDLGFKIPGLS